jgi:beta-alanine--pyruvate transaminase
VFEYCWQQGLYVRYGGNNISLAPPFISEKSEIDQMFNILSDAIRQLK